MLHTHVSAHTHNIYKDKKNDLVIENILETVKFTTISERTDVWDSLPNPGLPLSFSWVSGGPLCVKVSPA